MKIKCEHVAELIVISGFEQFGKVSFPKEQFERFCADKRKCIKCGKELKRMWIEIEENICDVD